MIEEKTALQSILESGKCDKEPNHDPEGGVSFSPLIRPPLSESYSLHEIIRIYTLLNEHNTFTFQPYSTGLFPAVGPGSVTEQTSGYRWTWVRDNVHIAYSHFVNGKLRVAIRNAGALASFFLKYRHRFTDIIEGREDPEDPMARPNIRFDGETLKEIDEKWPHAQNDALGYFLWFFCQLAIEGALIPTEEQRMLLADFVRYFKAIGYWRDEDSGHWEEQRKVSASSIGVVNAGLRAYRALLDQFPHIATKLLTGEDIDELLALGTKAMQTILPAECIQTSSLKKRRYDSALLFLVDPLDIVEPPMAEQIISDVTSTLQGEHGISRYRGDSYWGPDYRHKIPKGKWTADFSDNIEQRNSRASVPGLEAQWCIFDPLLSVIHGKKYLLSGDKRSRVLQTNHFNRSLSQLIEVSDGQKQLLCPEAYFLENGKYVPNDHVPFLWTQANLWRAFEGMFRSLSSA
jgi:hypothetical protein